MMPSLKYLYQAPFILLLGSDSHPCWTIGAAVCGFLLLLDVFPKLMDVFPNLMSGKPGKPGKPGKAGSASRRFSFREENRERQKRQWDKEWKQDPRFAAHSDRRPRICTNCGSMATARRWRELGGCPKCRCDFFTVVKDAPPEHWS